MIKPIIQYPTPLSVEYATDVRVFDATLFALIEDLKDTMNANNLDGLAAFQIGNYHNVIVVRDGDTIRELINPRMIKYEGTSLQKETTAYFPNREAQIVRYEKISVVYQNRDGSSCSLQAEGHLARVLQRKIDYTFGATFLQKMSKKQRADFEMGGDGALEMSNGDYCPSTFKRDKLLLGIKYIYLGIFLSIIVSFFLSDENKAHLWSYQLYTAYGTFVLNIVYLFYAYYEGKKYSSCISCQIGNIIGTTLVSLVKLVVLVGAAYFLVKPT